MKTKNPQYELSDMLRRFRNAQRRALFWSGNPSFSAGVAKATNSGRMADKYELAMCDQQSLAGIISDLGGSVKVRDYKAEFRARWAKLNIR